MNDEIKEILENIRKIIKSNRENEFNRVIYDCDSLEKVLDYITNLQEENENKDNKILELQLELLSKKINIKDIEYKEKMIYKSRCEKAIEYIEEKISSTQGVINDYMYHKEHNKILIELLQEDIEMYTKELHILNGSDE